MHLSVFLRNAAGKLVPFTGLVGRGFSASELYFQLVIDKSGVGEGTAPTAQIVELQLALGEALECLR